MLDEEPPALVEPEGLAARDLLLELELELDELELELAELELVESPDEVPWLARSLSIASLSSVTM